MADEFQGDAAEVARPPFSPSLALVTLARTVEVQLAGLLEPHGLTLRSYGILGQIAVTPGLSLSDLARRTRSTVPSVQVLIRSLADGGWVRSPTEGGDVAAQVTVTAAGSALLARLGRDLAAFDAQTFAGESGEELSAALARVAAEGAR